jgi:predicted HD phosphohydrolase
MMHMMSAERVGFRALSEATAADWAIIERAEQNYRRDPGRGAGLLALLASQENADPMGLQVNLYTHCLQTASRVLAAGLDDELVMVALIHDLPEALSDNHHGLLAAQLLWPWLSERRAWLLIHHVEFQALHFANHPTRNRHERDKYLGHRYFQETEQFCELYDQNSFDPDYPTLPIANFEPIVRRFFSRPLPAIPPLAD